MTSRYRTLADILSSPGNNEMKELVEGVRRILSNSDEEDEDSDSDRENIQRAWERRRERGRNCEEKPITLCPDLWCEKGYNCEHTRQNQIFRQRDTEIRERKRERQSFRVNSPPRNGAVFVQGISGRVYLMKPETQRREVHPRILETMPERSASAGYISSSGEITQTSGKVNQQNLNIRNLNDHSVLGPVFAERVKLHYDNGNRKWLSK